MPISENAPQNNSSDVSGVGGSQKPYYAVGTGAFDGEFSWVKIYVPNGQSTIITVEQNCDPSVEVGSPHVTYYLNDLADGAWASSRESETYNNGHVGGIYDEVKPDNGSCTSSITFPTVRASHGITSLIEGHDRWRVFYLVASISPSAGDNERSFRVNSSNPSSYVGGGQKIDDGGIIKASGKYSNGFGIYQRNAPNYGGGEEWDYEIEFTSICSQFKTNGTATIHLYDSDDESSGPRIYSPQHLTMTLERSPRQTNPSWSTYRTWTSLGTNHEGKDFNFIANNKFIYKLHITGINWRNTIQMELPFDQIDALPTGSTPGSTSCAGGGGGGGDTSCTAFKYDVTDHSYWRFSIFSIGSPPVVNVPYPNGAGGHSYAAANPDAGQWATFGTVPTEVKKFQFSSDHTYNAGLSPNYPPPSASGWYVLAEHWLHYDSDSDGTADAYKYFYNGLPFQGNCYSANCVVSIDGNLPDGSANVQAGSSYGATMIVNNTGRQPLQVPGDTVDPFTNNNLIPLSPATAPTTQGSYPNAVTAAATAAPYNSGYTVASCGADINVYQHFTLRPSAGIDPSTDDQDPTTVVYNTRVDYGPDPYPYPYPGPVSSGVHSILNFKPAAGALSTVKDVARSGSYTTTPYQDTYSNPGPIRAGDQFCPRMVIDNASGWIGPGGELYQQSDSADGGCMTVVNKPYFKVYGSGVSAGGGMAGGATGIVSSWNNNSGSYPFGAGAQIAALANGQITGFASAQGVPGGSTTYLSFANTTSTSIDSYNPKLGGNFGAYHPLTLIGPSAGTTVINGPYTLPATTVGAGDNRAIYVNGDAYIDGNVTYGGSPWNVSNVPSFVLIATGNIYIDPGVTNLDGIYTAQTSGKAIYTCGKKVGAAFQPLDKNNLFSCNKRLTIHGSFVADKINLMRTFGSLRDEKPTGAGSQIGLVWSCGGSICKPDISGMRCLLVNITGEDTSHTWADNNLCVPSGSSTHLGLTITTSPNTAAQAAINTGLPNCTNLKIPGEGDYWNDNWLCSDSQLTFSYTGPIAGQYCTPIIEPSDPDASGVWHDNKTYICEPMAASAAPSVVPTCNNSGSMTPVGRNGGDGMTPANGYAVFKTFLPSWRQLGSLTILAFLAILGLFKYMSYGAYDGRKRLAWNGLLLTASRSMAVLAVGVFLAMAAPIGITSAATGVVSTGGGGGVIPVGGGGGVVPVGGGGGVIPVGNRDCAAEVFDFSPDIYMSSPAIQLPSNGALQFDAITSLPPVL
ncbi:MAG: hypothetical protein AAB971_01670 [Patescibacteria group bacterium]